MANGSTSSKNRMQKMVTKVNGPTDPPKETGDETFKEGTWNKYDNKKRGLGKTTLTEGTPIRRTKSGYKEHHPNIQRSINYAAWDKPGK